MLSMCVPRVFLKRSVTQFILFRHKFLFYLKNRGKFSSFSKTILSRLHEIRNRT